MGGQRGCWDKIAKFYLAFWVFGVARGVLLGFGSGVGLSWRWRMGLSRKARMVYVGGDSGVGK